MIVINSYVIFFTAYVACVGRIDNVRFHYDRFLFLLSFLARYSKKRCTTGAAAATKTDYSFITETPLVCLLLASVAEQQMLAGSLLDEQCLSSSVLRVQVFRSCGNV